MINPSPTSIETVLGMLLDEFETPSRRAIAEFSKRYPEHRKALLDFAVAWAEDEYLPRAPALTPEQEELVAARAQSFLQNLLFEQELAEEPLVAPRGVATVAVQSLAQLAKGVGMSPHDAARQVGLDLDLLGEINRRGIYPQTIPKWIASAFAKLFSVEVAQIIDSWSLPASRAPAMSFLANAKPITPVQRSFQEAVRNSINLTDEEKANLLRNDD